MAIEKKGDMEVFREFLESSTIHGLYYVATAKVSAIQILMGNNFDLLKMRKNFKLIFGS